MTLASAIIQSAYREGNLLPAGTTGTTAQNAEALDRLNRFVRSLYGNDMGENLADWLAPSPQRTAPVAANYPQFPLACDLPSSVTPYPPKNSRIVYGATQSSTAYFPEAPDDGSRMGAICAAGAVDATTLTLDGNGRTIEGAATLVLTAPFTPKRWLYRADLGDWTLIADLAESDEMPFSDDMDDLFITGLAIRLAPGYDKQVGAETVSTFKTMLAKFRARYRQAGTTVFGSQDFPRSLQSYAAGSWGF